MARESKHERDRSASDARRMYRWDDESSRPELPREALRSRIAESLRAGMGVVFYGGRGLGKSYLIRQLEQDLADESVFVASLHPGSVPGTGQYLSQLASALGQTTTAGGTDPHAMISNWLDSNPGRQLVLIYDEVDQYMADQERGAFLFNALAAVQKKAATRIGILAAGGLGLIILGNAWSSPFVNRARQEFAPRFSLPELQELAEPLFLGESEPAVLDALLALTGGIPALAVWGLRSLWDAPPEARTPDRLRASFDDFDEVHFGFVRSTWSALGDGTDQDIPARTWRVLVADGSLTRHADLLDRMDLPPDRLRLGLAVLRAAGLVEHDRSADAGIRLVPSILSLPTRPAMSPPQFETLREHLRADLVDALRYIRRWGTTSYWRAGALMPEAVFQTAISITLASRGWTDVVQESEQGGGRADITARHPRFPGETALIEVKIWGRAGFRSIQDQVEKYRVEETTAIATAVFSAAKSVDAETFRSTCLGGDAESLDVASPLICLETQTRASEWPAVAVDHFLVRLPRGT